LTNNTTTDVFLSEEIVQEMTQDTEEVVLEPTNTVTLMTTTTTTHHLPNHTEVTTINSNSTSMSTSIQSTNIANGTYPLTTESSSSFSSADLPIEINDTVDSILFLQIPLDTWITHLQSFIEYCIEESQRSTLSLRAAMKIAKLCFPEDRQRILHIENVSYYWKNYHLVMKDKWGVAVQVRE
jgi:hypothetical protein